MQNILFTVVFFRGYLCTKDKAEHRIMIEQFSPEKTPPIYKHSNDCPATLFHRNERKSSTIE